MRESTALGSALLAGHALGLFGWDLNNPETLKNVNTAEVQYFEPQIDEKQRARMVRGWERAVARARDWHRNEEEELEEREREIEREEGLGSFSLEGMAEKLADGVKALASAVNPKA